MKDQILKIAKVKSEKEFYKKYPTEEAFMKAHGKAFKKAAMGAKMVNDQLHQLTDFGNPPVAQVGTYIGGKSDMRFNPINFNDVLGDVNEINTGISEEERLRQNSLSNVAPQVAQPQSQNNSGILSEIPGIIDELSPKKRNGGRKLKKGQNGLGPFEIGQMLGQSFQKQGGVGSGLVDIFSKKKGAGQGMLDASANLFKDPKTGKGIGFKAGLKVLGDSGNLGTIGKAAGVGLLNAAPQVLQGIGRMKEQKANITKANQFAQISGLTAQAAESQPEIQKRRYVRPEDALVQPGQMGNPQGTGTNFLSAQNGTSIDGNPTEIQNTYAPEDIYVGLGYEPLNDSNIKQYARGGNIPTAEFGEYFQDSGQASIGSGIGSAVGSVFGPLGSKVGGFIGRGLGNLSGGVKDARELQHYQEQGMKNTERAAWAQGAQAIHSQNAAFMKDGGYIDDEHAWVSNSWQPQVITKFGEHSMKELLQPPHDADMLRAGGTVGDDYYTPPSAEAMYTGKSKMAMGGDLQTHWGGEAETMSYNPYLPDGGETVMFRGQSHDETDHNGKSGIGVTYGDSPVEVERGEPAVKLKDGGESGEDNLVVFGNMMIPSYGVEEIGDKNAKGKKFKNYVADLSKKEAKQNKTIEKATELVNNANGNDPYDQLSLNSGKAMIMGANLKLKDIADKKQKAAMIQNAILDTAEEFGIESDGLAKGKIRAIKDPSIGKDGKKLKKAQSGNKLDLRDLLKTPDRASAMSLNTNIPYSFNDLVNLDPITREAMRRGMVPPKGMPGSNSANELDPVVVSSSRKMRLPADVVKMDRVSNPIAPLSIDPNIVPDIPMAKSKGKGIDWKLAAESLLSGVGDLLRPRTTSPLDPSQLMSEMYALGNNQVDPVYAQTYQPMLDNVYDVSLQDQINAIDAQARAAIIAAGQDPSAQSYIMAQAADLKNKVLGEQFRLNQMNRAQVFQGNRAAINDAMMKNLGILDNQQVRQATARSRTKEQTIEALSSIADKIAKNKLENRQIGVMENLYGFRFTDNDRVYNANNPYFFTPPTVGSNMLGGLSEYEKAKAITNAYEKKTKNLGKDENRNGTIVKAFK